ncbi:hypothetical protein EYD10_07839 [Varanus komodoensis]|nr:hypothetical protein EYD10_07839 [Varanus komodoensis]
MRVKEESSKVGLKFNIKKNKIMAFSPITSWQIDGEEMEEGHLAGGESIHSAFQELITEINQPTSAYTLKTANRLYGKKTFNFIDEYLQLTKKYYHAELQPVDFSEQVRREINSWVQGQTENKIKDLLPQGSLDYNTILVVINAIYFKGKWKKSFQKENTAEKLFRLSKSQSKPVQMMFLKDKFPIFYVDTLKVHILELPYVNNELSMFILLPEDIMDDSTGLKLLEEELTYERLSTWTNPERMKQEEVEVHLPRIKLEEKYDLRSTLVSLGMTDAFDDSLADFTGMSKNKGLYVSEIYHKAFVEINEEGTEATGSTGVVVVVRRQPIKIDADHPFLFFIRHNKTKYILFFGRFCSP